MKRMNGNHLLHWQDGLLPNQECMVDFCRNTLPLIQAQRSDANLLIIGANPSSGYFETRPIAGSYRNRFGGRCKTVCSSVGSNGGTSQYCARHPEQNS